MKELEKILYELSEGCAIFLNTHDEHLSEFTNSENNDVLQATGFSGSNGYALITKERNIFFTDSRYTIQAKNEIPPSFEVRDMSAFVSTLQAKKINTLFLNFAKVSVRFVEKIKKVLPQLAVMHLKKGASKPFVSNDNFYEINTGLAKEQKLQYITKHLKANNKDAFLVTDPHDICWILNIRGTDEAFTPVYKTTLLVKNDGNYIINPSLQEVKGNIFIDEQINFLQYNIVPAIKEFSNLITNYKAVKNDYEIMGMINAHKIDGKIVTNFLIWLEENYKDTTEWEVSQKLLEFRKSHKSFKMPSFATICGCNANGAIVHYNAKQETANVIKKDSVLLIDSGGQFYDKNILGTTDITRTLFLGETPPENYKKIFTLVLKGHIAVATAVFDEKTPSSDFDDLARKYLKQHNLDYGHATGHGVGAFLSVHEAGCGISSHNANPLKEGMILSNEPGCYVENKFGIRIESLILVKKHTEGSLLFETITLAPIQVKSIDFTLLTKDEIQWLESYNKKCMENLSNNL